MPVEILEDPSTAAALLYQSGGDISFWGEMATAGSAQSIAITGTMPVEVLAAQIGQPPAIPTRFRFGELVRTWKRDCRFMSSLAKMVMHPSYQAIIGMGKDAVPLLLTELQHSPDHWLWALRAITQEDPAPTGADFATAVDAWLVWGRAHGYL